MNEWRKRKDAKISFECFFFFFFYQEGLTCDSTCKKQKKIAFSWPSSNLGHMVGPSFLYIERKRIRFLEFSCLFLSFEAYVFPSCNSVAYHSLSHNHFLTLLQKSTKAPAFYFSFSLTYSHPHPLCKNPPWLWSWSEDQFSPLSLTFWSTGWPLVRFWASSKTTNSMMVFWKSWKKHWILSADYSTMRRRSRLQSLLWRTGLMMLNMLSMKPRTYWMRLIMNIYDPRTLIDMTAIG